MTVTATLGSGAEGYALIVHGGAGDTSGARLDGQIDGCHRAVEEGKRILEASGSALDAVQAAVQILEDDPRFNAATGGALTCEGTLELDASIMEGTQLRAGAVCGLIPFKHPIAIARAALQEGRHVLYCGPGAAAFARAHGFEACDPAEMITAEAREFLAQALARASAPPEAPCGTVGAVARDVNGQLAAATSTGGISGKRPGRVGDSPLLGAGTYADDNLGAASATGQGEGIMRVALTSRIVQALDGAQNPGNVAFDALELMKRRTGARGGVIVIGRDGRIGWARSTSSMAYAATWTKHKISAGG
jgi:beta-aspartyl-peptidase (threonine type)